MKNRTKGMDGFFQRLRQEAERSQSIKIDWLSGADHDSCGDECVSRKAEQAPEQTDYTRIPDHTGKFFRADDAAPAQAEPAKCTNEDAWNCKYCRNTGTCEVLADKRNFGEPAPAQDGREAIHLAFEHKLREVNLPVYGEHRGDWRTLTREEAADVVIELLRARPAQTAPQPPVPESWWRLIRDTLLNYRMRTLKDGYGGGYPLIDALTADGQPASSGSEECTYMADAIWNALRAAPIAQTAPQPERSGLAEAESAIRKFESANWHGSKGYHAGLLKAAEIVAALAAQGDTNGQE